MERKNRLSSLLTRKYLVIPKLFVPFLVFTQEKSATVDVTSITLDPATASMTLGGETLTLTPTVLPADATDKTVTWTTSNASVATVADGIVTAVAAGTVTITANANAGSGVTDTCTVTVTAPATKYDITVGENEHGTVAFTVDGAAATQAKKDDVVTVSVTPAEGYSTKDVTVRAYTTWAAAPARAKSRAAAPELKDNIDVTAGENGTWTFTMPEANVWVKDAGTLAAGKCWIELVPSSPAHARALSIVFEGETTGINAVSSSADKMDGEWYDLSGYPTHTGRIVFDDYTAWRNIFAYPSL